VLWTKIINDIGGTAAPSSLTDLRDIFIASFEKLTGQKIQHDEIVYLSDLDTGGMSGGQIMPLFFYEAILPFVEAQFLVLGKDHYQKGFDDWCG
jgi:hypothetical protein